MCLFFLILNQYTLNAKRKLDDDKNAQGREEVHPAATLTERWSLIVFLGELPRLFCAVYNSDTVHTYQLNLFFNLFF